MGLTDSIQDYLKHIHALRPKGQAVSTTALATPMRVAPAILGAIPRVTAVDRDGGDSFTLQVEGDMDPLVGALAPLGASEIETRRALLEETFTAYDAGRERA